VARLPAAGAARCGRSACVHGRRRRRVVIHGQNNTVDQAKWRWVV
jgi:hypothetical protein